MSFSVSSICVSSNSVPSKSIKKETSNAAFSTRRWLFYFPTCLLGETTHDQDELTLSPNLTDDLIYLYAKLGLSRATCLFTFQNYLGCQVPPLPGRSRPSVFFVCGRYRRYVIQSYFKNIRAESSRDVDEIQVDQMTVLFFAS